MSRTFTRTPRTSTEGSNAAASGDRMIHLANVKRFGDLRLDPAVGARNPFFKGDLRLPPEDLAEPRVVRVAASHALRARDMPPADGESRGVGDEIGERVDADQAVLPEIQRLAIRGSHQPLKALDAIVDVAEGSGLFPIAPD